MRSCLRVTLILTIVVAALAAGHAAPALARDYHVDTTADDPTLGTCDEDAPVADCSLRGALADANARPDTEESTIYLPSGTYLLTTPTPCVFRTYQLGTHGLTTTALCIAGRITLRGSQGVASSVIIDGNSSDRVVLVGNDAPARIEHVTIRGGAQQGGTLIGGGGGVNNGGDLTLLDSVVTANSARAGGGGVYSSGTLRVRRCRIANNTSAGPGGGVEVSSFNVPVDASILDSTIANNTSAEQQGGGIFVYGGNNGGTTEIKRSTISGNEATFQGGGGICVAGNRQTVNIESSTISGNRAGWYYGGGLWSTGVLNDVHLRNVTVSNNRSQDASGTRGGAGGVANDEASIMTFGNTVVAGNFAPDFAPDCYDGGRATRIGSDGYNIIGNQGPGGDGGTYCDLTTADGDQLNVDPQLEPLRDNGGLTETHGTVLGSPAIDGGAPSGCRDTGGNVLTGDQRGEPSPTDGDGDGAARCDAGSYENGGGFGVGEVVPPNGGNGGAVCALIHGRGFADGATVKLTRPGAPDIAGSPVNVSDDGTVIATSFDLAGRATGDYAIEVENPDATTTVRSSAFTVEAGGQPDVWAEIIGPLSLRRGRWTRFFFVYGNRGNADALGVPIQIAAAPGVGLQLSFSAGPPPANPDQVFTDWSTISTAVDARPVTDYTVYPFLLPIVPAGYTGSLEFRVNLPADVPGATPLLVPFIGAPVARPDGPDADIEPDVDAEYVQHHVDNALRYARDVLAITPPTDLAFMTGYVGAQLGRMVRLGGEAWITTFGEPDGDGSGSGGGGAGSADGTKAGGDDSSPVRCLEPCVTIDVITSTAVENGNPPPPIPVAGGGAGCSGDRVNGCPSKKRWPGGRQCACPPPTDPVAPFDPNGKFGSAMGTGYVSDDEPLRYTILFENDPVLASAAAQEVLITDALDADKLDLDTFSLGPIVFGNRQVFPPAGVQDFFTDVDLRPEQNLIVRIRALLERATGVVTWRFISLDPETLDFPEDALAGFLPPNVNPPAGDGGVSFTVKAKPLLPSGTQVCNDADIVFDTNPPIITPAWCNGIDRDPPQSAVAALPPVSSSTDIALSWNGSDVGSRIVEYQVFASTDGGPYELVVPGTLDTQATFSGVAGRSYAFYSVARDDAGNVEAAPPAPDATTRVGTPVSARNMAVTVLRGPKRATFKEGSTSAAQRFAVVLQNRGATPEVIPDAAALAALVRLELESIASPACTPAPVVSLKPIKARQFPIRLKPKGKRAVLFEARLACAGDPAKGPGHEDYRVTARVDLAALAGVDGYAQDDVCPRRVSPPGVPVPNLDGSILDKGCGARLADGTFGGPVLLDVVLKPR